MKRKVLLLVALCTTVPAGAEDWVFGGHAKYQFTHTDYRADDVGAVFGDDPAHDQDVDFRFKAERRAGAWDVVAHYELLGVRGDSTEVRHRMAALGLVDAAGNLPDDRRRLFDLTHEITDSTRSTVVHRLDRLSLGHTGDATAWRVGRQVISWGNGLVFHPLDFVNPFSPVAIDKDYKTGDDMLFGQWTLPPGGDVQAIAVPRRDASSHDVESEESTMALKWRTRAGEFDVDLIGARHYGEGLFGVGVARGIGGAVWRFDAGYVDLKDGEGVWSWVSNLDYSWTWAGRNVYGYAEYFRNALGESDREGYVAPNPALAARLARGELYTLGRDYLGLGLQIEIRPLVNLFTGAIRNLDDGSGYLQIRGVYDWREDTQVMAGVNLPAGERGEEYGGVPLAGTTAYVAAGRSAYLRAAYYY